MPGARVPVALAVAAAVLLTAVLYAGERSGHQRIVPTAAAGPTGVEPAVDRLTGAEGRGAPGAAALTVGAGGARYTAAGVADVADGRPVRRADRFRAGSITKTFLATVVLQLAAEGRLGLDDTVQHHLPGLVRGSGNDGRRITVRQLLNQTSGLYDYTADPVVARRLTGGGFAAHRYDTHTPASLVRTALGHRPTAAPGTAWHYSNTNYVLLGLVVEAVTGRAYADEVRERILRPLGLHGTSFPGTRATLPAPHGRGYSTRRGDRLDVTDLDPSVAGAAGEAVSTLDDLTRFYRALLGGELLPARWLRVMRDTGASGGTYGMGLYPVRLPCGVTLWGHNGVIGGSYALVVADRAGGRVLGYRVNTDTPPEQGTERALLSAAFC